jgi:hypothetical protein
MDFPFQASRLSVALLSRPNTATVTGSGNGSGGGGDVYAYGDVATVDSSIVTTNYHTSASATHGRGSGSGSGSATGSSAGGGSGSGSMGSSSSFAFAQDSAPIRLVSDVQIKGQDLYVVFSNYEKNNRNTRNG